MPCTSASDVLPERVASRPDSVAAAPVPLFGAGSVTVTSCETAAPDRRADLPWRPAAKLASAVRVTHAMAAKNHRLIFTRPSTWRSITQASQRFSSRQPRIGNEFDQTQGRIQPAASDFGEIRLILLQGRLRLIPAAQEQGLK